MAKEHVNELELTDQELESLYREIHQPDVSKSAAGDICAAREALELIARVRNAEQLETAKSLETVYNFLGTGGVEGSELDFPESIGRFAIKKPIGSGGFGMVFLAQDPNLERDVALKIPRLEAITTPDLKSRFVREGQAAAALSHPNIVPVFESGQVGSICYLASQFVDGETLAEWAGKQDMVTPLLAAEICQAIAEGIAHAHQRGVLHRDIKPANILVAKPSLNDANSDAIFNRIQITDFGLAKSIGDDSSETQTGALIGTPSYMSPEQAAQKPATGSADVYSVGAVLYFLLTGRPPFQNENILSTIQDVIQKEPTAPSKFNSSVPADLEAICLKCLEKNPSSRYSSAFELQADLNRFQHDEPVLARPVTQLNRLTRWSRRNPMIAGLLTAVSLLLVTALAATAFGLIRSNQALQRESAALAIEKRALGQAKLATETANQRYLAHKDAIDTYFTTVSENEMLKATPGSPELRKKLLHLALEYYQQYVQQQSDDPDLALDVAQAETRIAKIFQEMEGNEIALTHAEHAIELLESIDESNTTSEVRFALGEALHQKYFAIKGGGKLDEASPVLQDAILIMESLSETETATDAKMLWADLLGEQAVNLRNTGKLPESKLAFEEVGLIYELISQLQDGPDVQLKRLDILGELATVEKQSNNLPGAIEIQKHLFDELHKLVQDNPTNWEAVESFVVTGLNFGWALLISNQTDEAARVFGLSDPESERLATLFPTREKYASFRAGLFLRLSVLMNRQGDRAGELIQLKKAADIYRERVRLNPTSIRMKSMLTDGQVNLSTVKIRDRVELESAKIDLAEAETMLREMVNAEPDFVNHQASLAAGLRMQSLLHLFDKQYESAIASANEAKEISQRLISENVRPRLLRDVNLDTHLFLGKAFYNTDRFDEAVTSWEAALASEAPALSHARNNLNISIACALQQLDNFDAAQDRIDSLDLEKLGAKDMIAMANYHCILAAKSESDSEQIEFAKSWLQKAADKGYFSNAWLIDEFESKQVFSALRETPEVQAILETAKENLIQLDE